jgi:hypothetical protein
MYTFLSFYTQTNNRAKLKNLCAIGIWGDNPQGYKVNLNDLGKVCGNIFAILARVKVGVV